MTRGNICSIGCRICAASLILVPALSFATGDNPFDYMSSYVEGNITTAIDNGPMGHFVFRDVPKNAWYAGSVFSLAEAGIIRGYTDATGKSSNRFGPNDKVTLAQAIKMALLGAGRDFSTADNSCGQTKDWFCRYNAMAQNEKFTLASASLVDRPATRGEVAQIIADAFIPGDIPMHPFGEMADVSQFDTYEHAILKLHEDGVVTGDQKKLGNRPYFRPYEPMNRSEIAAIIDRAWHIYRSDVIHYSQNGFEPLTTEVWPFSQVQVWNESNAKMQLVSDEQPAGADKSFMNGDYAADPGGMDILIPVKSGTYKFHDRLSTDHRGTMIVR